MHKPVRRQRSREIEGLCPPRVGFADLCSGALEDIKEVEAIDSKAKFRIFYSVLYIVYWRIMYLRIKFLS